MRGGAWPLLGFGTLMVLMMGLNWVWTDDTIQIVSFAFAASVAYLAAAVLILLGRREPLRRGAPRAVGAAESIPAASLGAALVGFAVATIVFGLVWGRFLIFFGAGLLIASVGIVARELTVQRRARRALTPERDR
jgi:hypothetical protein